MEVLAFVWERMKVPAVLVFFILDLTMFQCQVEMDT